MKELSIETAPRVSPVQLPKNLGFGQIFTDHIFEMDYTPESGWHNASIHPMQNFQMHPATMVFHYGQALFEGMKAFKQFSGDIVVFRADKHFRRLNNSARRLCMPEIDPEMITEALCELIWIDRDWIPSKKGESLYLRPFMMGVDPVLGVRPSTTYKFIIILSPVGAYYPEGFKPIKILIQDDYVRAVRKGLGEAKTPANYAASLLGAELARRQGYTQVLWLDAVELRNIEEVGTMNIYVRFNDEVVTPKLTGGILPGITRMSVLEILKDWGYPVVERPLSLDEFIERHKAGEVLDVFGTGTASVISSVAELKYRDTVLSINDGHIGELARNLFDELTGFHYGLLPDRFGWLTNVEAAIPAV